MATDAGEQLQDYCRILVLTDEGVGRTNVQCESQSENRTSADASVNCYRSADHGNDETSETFASPCSIRVDIETGSADVSRNNQESGSVKSDIALTKPLRRQNSTQAGESIAPLMDQILTLLKFDPREKQAFERAHEVANNRWRKYKRAASF